MKLRRPIAAYRPAGAGHVVDVETGQSGGSALEIVPVASSVAKIGPTVVLGTLSERVFQAQVVAGLRQRGFTVVVIPDMRRTQAGWPDLAFFHSDRPGRLWIWELKTERGRVRPEQRETIDLLATVPGVDARVVRPSDWAELSKVLPPAQQQPQPAPAGEEE